MAYPKLEASNVVIISTILVYDYMASVLFVHGSTLSYVSMKFGLGLDLECEFFILLCMCLH